MKMRWTAFARSRDNSAQLPAQARQTHVGYQESGTFGEDFPVLLGFSPHFI